MQRTCLLFLGGWISLHGDRFARAQEQSDLGNGEQRRNGLYDSDDAVSVEADVRIYPYSTIGKLINYDRDGVKHCCTGVFVDQRIVQTAAQCVIDREGHVFYQQYNHGRGFQKRVVQALVNDNVKAELQKGNLALDYALLVVQERTSGGFLDVINETTNDFPQENITIAGYDLGGEVLHMIGAKHVERFDGVATVRLAGKMKGKCVGGSPWLAQRRDGRTYVVGILSPSYGNLAKDAKNAPDSGHTEL